MNFIFTNAYNQQVNDAWNRFIANQPIPSETVRPEILEMWHQFRKNHVDPYKSTKPLIESPQDLASRIKRNKLMYDISLPFMDRIYNQIKGSSSLVVLTDADGVILEVLKDDKFKTYVSNNGFIPGAHITINTGNMEILLCKQHKKAFWCWDEENFCINNKGWSCVAAPILNRRGALSGILSISNETKNAHPHTMGMAISSAAAIENEIKMQEIHNYNIKIMHQFSSTIESIPLGIILIDSKGIIQHINHFAKEVLNLTDISSPPQKIPIGNVLVDKNRTFSSMPVSSCSNREFTLNINNSWKRYYLTIRNFIPDVPSMSSTDNWMLILVNTSDSVKKTAHQVFHSHAKYSFKHIIGESETISEAKRFAELGAKSDSTLMLYGPSGTGKELFAHAIHGASPRSSGPFISLNCGALPANLVESELFGYEDGAFTGARKGGQPGKFELADGGTLFLDEIGEMPLAIQASMLRVLETKEVVRLGGSKSNFVDVRIIAATNRNLMEATQNKEFREDLYYRLNVLTVYIPPLRMRGNDIYLLADNFIHVYCEKLHKTNIIFSKEAYQTLMAYDWPGNVRELENVIERIINFTESSTIIYPDYLASFLDISTNDMDEKTLSKSTTLTPSPHSSDEQSLSSLEKDLILKVLQTTKGNISACARMIGISRKTLYKKFRDYDIDYTIFRP